MSEDKFETISSLADNYQLNDSAIKEIVDDQEQSEQWSRYHLIGDVMRDDVPSTIDTELSMRIADAIADEPTVLAPVHKPGISQQVKAKVISFVKPMGQVAIAASAAGLMVLGVQQNVAQNDVTSPSQIMQTRPLIGTAQPVSLNYQQPDRKSQQQVMVEQQRKFQALLQDHKQQVKFSSMNEKSHADDAKEQEALDTPQ
ncbi:sigma-E factor negative regulatory protein [Thalassotalea fusca]